MNNSSQMLGIIVALSLVIGGTVGFTGMTYINGKKADQYSERDSLRLAVSNEEKASVTFDASNKEYRENNNLNDVVKWTELLEDMPKIKQRSEFADAILKATKDGVITDAEWQELSIKKHSLDTAVINITTRDNANNLLDGKTVVRPIDSEEVNQSSEYERFLRDLQDKNTKVWRLYENR